MALVACAGMGTECLGSEVGGTQQGLSQQQMGVGTPGVIQRRGQIQQLGRLLLSAEAVERQGQVEEPLRARPVVFQVGQAVQAGHAGLLELVRIQK